MSIPILNQSIIVEEIGKYSSINYLIIVAIIMSAPLRVSKRKNKGKNKYLETLLKEENDALVITNKDNKNIKIDRGYTVYCNVCNTTDDNYDELTDPFGDMIQCDRCDTWQHINCILKNQNEPIEKFFLDNDQYICNQCDPMRYPHLLSPKIKNTMISILLSIHTKNKFIFICHIYT